MDFTVPLFVRRLHTGNIKCKLFQLKREQDSLELMIAFLCCRGSQN